MKRLKRLTEIFLFKIAAFFRIKTRAKIDELRKSTKNDQTGD